MYFLKQFKGDAIDKKHGGDALNRGPAPPRFLAPVFKHEFKVLIRSLRGSIPNGF